MENALETLKLEITNKVAKITLNRPDRLNAWTDRMGAELFSTMHRLDMDDDVRAMVVTGEGRAFCAGADLDSGGDTFAGDDAWKEGRKLGPKVEPWNMRTPVIGAINGPAVGIGATLPLHWDIRFASDKARIGFVFTRRGIIPEAASTWFLPRLVGMSRALEILLSGRILSAQEALEAGLISRVIPHDELMSVTMEFAQELAANTAPVAVAVTKRLVWRNMMEPNAERAKAFEDRLFDWAGKQPDCAEGVNSFLEKRNPEWKMRASTDLPDEIANDL